MPATFKLPFEDKNLLSFHRLPRCDPSTGQSNAPIYSPEREDASLYLRMPLGKWRAEWDGGVGRSSTANLFTQSDFLWLVDARWRGLI